MYSNKSNVNLLTALLIAHGIEDAVVCPGSRNAPFVHNLHVSQHFRLHSVVDERSAAFVAIGLWLKTRRPILLAVTSGSALLNTLPGVAEAAFRHIPLIVVSADRPPAWIGQLDGQTLPQIGALHPYANTWNLIEPQTLEETNFCQRLINEALLAIHQGGRQPIHINLPISEPLFDFSLPQLPHVHPWRHHTKSTDTPPLSDELIARIEASRCPVVVVGQYEEGVLSALDTIQKQHQMLVYSEVLSQQQDTLMAAHLDKGNVKPDFILHIGGAMINKAFKLYLRSLKDCPVVRISTDGSTPDTFLHLDTIIEAEPEAVFQQLAKCLSPKPEVKTIYQEVFSSPPISLSLPQVEAIFLGNSTAVRWGNRHFVHTHIPIYGNRGTNGIEGSLSVAAGYSLVSEGITLCILGDLSFFYDANALWNARLDNRLRVLIVNNQRGGIFHNLPGLLQSPALDLYIAAQHKATARGIVESYGAHYLCEHLEDFEHHADRLLRHLISIEMNSPIVLEVFVS